MQGTCYLHGLVLLHLLFVSGEAFPILAHLGSSYQINLRAKCPILAGGFTDISRQIVAYVSDFQPFSSHGPPTLITKILQHTKKYIFCRPDKKKKQV